MRKVACFMMGLCLLVGCGNQGAKTGVVTDQKWKGLPYRLTLGPTDAKDAKAAKPNPAMVTIPPVTFVANPEAVESRAILVMRFVALGTPDQTPHLMIGTPVDIHGENGSLSADYLTQASKSVTDYLAARCIQGNVKVSLALARSSVKPLAEDAEVDSKRLSDWVSFQTTYKKAHGKC